MGQGDGLLQRLVINPADVGLHKAQQIRRAGLDAIGLVRQHAGADPDGLVLFRIAIGITRHGLLRHIDIGVVQAKPRQERLLHQASKRLLQAARRQVAEQPYAGVRVLAMGTRRVGWGPLAVVGLHLLERIHLLGELQRQAARAVGSQLPHGDAVKGGSLEPGGVPARLVIQFEPPLDHRIGS